MATHRATVFVAKGEPFQLQTRPTPKPGPGELLIEVKSVALNPADHIMRNTGLFVSTFPAVTGFDMSGLVLEVGDNVPTDPCFQPGKRVAAYSASAFNGCHPDYGVFQERCLVPWQHVAPLPEKGITWNEAATLPVAVEVPLNAWDLMKIPRIGQVAASVNVKQERKREALLIWGASSSVGTMGVQTGRLLRDDPNSPFAALYATSGAANHEYVRSLGADRVFDYKDPQVVDAIVSAAREDGLVIRHCFLAMGQLTLCQSVLKAFVTDVEGPEEKSKIASAPPVPADAEDVDGVETIFIFPSTDEEERLAQFQYWIVTWLRENLIKGTIKPSPRPELGGRGLEAINAGLDVLSRGVSCTKLVIEIAN